MKTNFLFLLLSLSAHVYPYDSTKCSITAKIMNESMLPIYSDSNITDNNYFNSWLLQHKVTKIKKMHKNKYDTIGEFRFKYIIYHDTDAFVLASLLDTFAGIKEVFVNARYLACGNPYTINDPFIGHQTGEIDEGNKWQMDLVDAQCAWSITTGNPNVKIGVIDTYMDTFHEDMRGKFKIWKHPTFDFSGIEDIHGALDDEDLQFGKDFYHGMKVCGAISTKFNNNKGIAGIGGNCSLAGYSYFYFDGNSLGDIIMEAADDGVKVINCSWNPTSDLAKEIEYAISKGVVFTHAAASQGNSNDNTYQGEGFITVTSVDVNNEHGVLNSANSRYGHSSIIDMCAPTDFSSTKIQSHPAYPGNADEYQWHWYQNSGGTSTSAPLVAGIVGLMFSVNPNLSPAAIECLLKAGCVTVADGDNFEGQLGAGTVNAYNSVTLALGESGSRFGTHTWSELRHVANDVTLEEGCTLTITHKILISPYRKIFIKPGAKLIVDGGILTNLCGDKPWGGIVVLGNSALSQTPANQGVVELKNNSVIENALTGVRAIGFFDGTETPRPSTAKGIVQASNTTFKNNKTDVLIFGQTRTSTLSPKSNVSYFRKCNFYTTDENLMTSLSQHINLIDCNGLNITGCTFEDQRTGLIPKSQGRIGVNASAASFNITDYNNGVTETHTQFINLKQNIQSIAVPPDSRSSVSNCSSNSYKGFYFFKSTNARILNNTFTVKDDLFANSITNYPYGIYVDGTTVFDIEANTCNGSRSNANKKGGHAGLMIRNSGANTNTFYRNTFANITVASEAVGANKDGNDALRGLKFRCNEYSNDIKDLQVLPDPVIGATGAAGMAEMQGSLVQPADNLFGNSSAVLILNIENNPYNLMYFHQDENSGTVNSRTKPFLVANVNRMNTSWTSPSCPDNLNKSGSGWPSTPRTNLATLQSFMDPLNAAWKGLVDNGNNPTNVVNDIETATTGNATSVYNQLMSYSPWLSMEALGALAAKEGAFSDFEIYNVLRANPQAGRSAWIKTLLLNRGAIFPTGDLLAIVANADSITNRDTVAMDLSEANTNYDVLLNDLVGWYLDDTLDRLATLDTLLTHPYNPMYRYQLAGLYFERDMYEVYQQVLDSIPAQIDLTPEQTAYHETFNTLHNKIKEWKLDTVPLPLLDSARLEWLNEFYTEHQDMPGIGHALLAINDMDYHFTDPVYITDTIEDEGGGEPFVLHSSDLKNTKENLIKVYPNPTNKEVILEWKNRKLTKDVKVTLVDAYGKIIMNKTWDSSQKALKLDLEGNSYGVYYIEVTDKNRIKETYKILLVK